MDEVDALRDRIKNLRTKAVFWKSKWTEERYEELQTSLESVEFYLERLALVEANTELARAVSIAGQSN
jgi:hypothetical protein